MPTELLTTGGHSVRVSGRGECDAPPAWLRCAVLPEGGGHIDVAVGPWAHDLRWWDPATRRRVVRWQLVVGGVACLVVLDAGRAALEAVYD